MAHHVLINDGRGHDFLWLMILLIFPSILTSIFFQEKPSFRLLHHLQSLLLGSLALKEGAFFSIPLDDQLGGGWFKPQHSRCLGNRHIGL